MRILLYLLVSLFSLSIYAGPKGPLCSESLGEHLFKPGDTLLVQEESNLPELPENLEWEYMYTEEPPLTGSRYVVVSTAPLQSRPVGYVLGDTVSVVDESQLPELPTGLKWEFKSSDEPPIMVYEVVQD